MSYFYAPINIYMRKLILIIAVLFTIQSNGQIRILFDATKAESAGNADWVIDADLHNLGYSTGPAVVGGGTESNPQRIPTPAQSGITAATAETYWEGALSFWGIDCVRSGYTVETLPYNGSITYGNAANAQDLTNYRVFIVCEPNIIFTAAEKTAILNFVNHGGGLFMISDHNVSDRNNDGFDSPHIWNDMMQTNSTGNTNPFGIIFDLANFSQTTSNIATVPANDSIIHGPMGDVTMLQWNNGTSMTLSTTANPSAKAFFYETGVSNTGSTSVMFATSRYGYGKVAAIGDSSPCDDGTGDPGDALFPGYNGDVTPNHRHILMNSTIWLASGPIIWIGLTSTDWTTGSNWLGGVPPTLTDDALIPPGTPFSPVVLNGKVGNCKDLMVISGAVVNIQATGNLNVSH